MVGCNPEGFYNQDKQKKKMEHTHMIWLLRLLFFWEYFLTPKEDADRLRRTSDSHWSKRQKLCSKPLQRKITLWIEILKSALHSASEVWSKSELTPILKPFQLMLDEGYTELLVKNKSSEKSS